MTMENYGGMILTGENQITLRTICPTATLSTIDPAWTDLGANPGLAVKNHIRYIWDKTEEWIGVNTT